MDEIWKDINLISSLHRPNGGATTTAPGFHLQDYILPSPTPAFTKVNPPAQPLPLLHLTNNSHRQPPPATTLNLSTCDSRNMKSKSKQQKETSSPSLISSSCGTHHSHKRASAAETHDEADADGRFKRMIKNRESAARSRDRKHAYTYELELEVARLKEENAKLRKQQMLFLPAPTSAAQLPKKPTLCRTLTAPF